MTSPPEVIAAVDKASRRRAVLAARARRAPEVLARASGLVAAELLRQLDQRRPACVALYAALPGELDLAHAFRELVRRDVIVVFPRTVTATRQLDFVAVATRDALVPGTFGVPEPTGEAVPLASIDVVVQPGLGFDRRGVRLGYGAGYYDRTLARHHGLRVGCCFASEWVDELPREPHDVCVHLVITDDGTHCVDHPASGR